MKMKLVATGRELEDCVGQLSKWAGADIDIAFLEKKAKNPPWYKTFSGSQWKSVRLKIYAAKKSYKSNVPRYSFGAIHWWDKQGQVS